MTVKRDGELAFDLDATFPISMNQKVRFSFAKENENDLDEKIVGYRPKHVRRPHGAEIK